MEKARKRMYVYICVCIYIYRCMCVYAAAAKSLQSCQTLCKPMDCYCTTGLILHTSRVMLRILQARLQQYLNQEFPDVQAGFTKCRGTRDQTANILWIKEKAREFQKNISIYFIDNNESL